MSQVTKLNINIFVSYINIIILVILTIALDLISEL